jgi:signal peptidase I
VSTTSRVLFGENPRRTAIRIIVLVALCAITFKWVLIPIRTEGISMLPTYTSGTLNLVNRLSYTHRRPRRGDVVAIRLAGENVLYIKRVIGLPGERIAISEGQVLINGSPWLEPYVRHRRPWNYDELTLGPREYFVMGDNRGMAAADHDFGPVDADRIIGRVVF